MFKFKKENGLHFFGVFLVITAITFGITSITFVQYQARETSQSILDISNQERINATQEYITQILTNQLMTLNKLSTDPVIQSAILQGVASEQLIKDKVELILPQYDKFPFFLFDFMGHAILKTQPLPDQIQDFIIKGTSDESLLQTESAMLVRYDGYVGLLLTTPVFYNDTAEGMVAYIVPSPIYLGLSQDELVWYGISQQGLGWESSIPQGWYVEKRPLSNAAFDIQVAFSPKIFSQAESEFFYSMLRGLSLASIISLFLLYFVGRKFLLSPYQELYKSQQELSHYTSLLEEKEKESAYLARVAKFMRDAVVFTNKDQKITWINGAFEKLSGYKFEEVYGKKPGSVLQGADTSPEIRKQLHEAIQQQKPCFVEIVNYSKTGRKYWVEVALTPLFDDDNELEGFMAVERDISDRVALEESLRSKAIEAEAANIAKSQFLASMSHELRTPMNGVLGMGEILNTTKLSVEQQDFVDTLLSSGQHMLSVLNDILDFSKIEAGVIDINEESFPAANIVRKVVRMYDPICIEKGVQFSYEAPQDFDNYLLLSDEKRLTQILQNIVGNAVKFTPEGRISLKIILSGSPGDAQLQFVVADTGIGISRDRLESIFDPFVQEDSKNTRSYGGTGLGLAISLEIAKAIGGDIKVDSEKGKGSIFTVSLPMKYVQIQQRSVIDEKPHFNGTGLTTLIVEDNRVNALLLQRHLSSRGFKTDIAANGEEAVNKVKQSRYHCIFMDNHMPVKDGVAAAGEIQTLDLEQKPIMIGCTADAFEETTKAMKQAGCMEVITKPISGAKIDEVLYTWLGGTHSVMQGSKNQTGIFVPKK